MVSPTPILREEGSWGRGGGGVGLGVGRSPLSYVYVSSCLWHRRVS